MHLEATAVLFGVKLRDLGGKLTRGKPFWRHFGAKFGHLVGDVEAICQILSGHVVGGS